MVIILNILNKYFFILFFAHKNTHTHTHTRGVNPDNLCIVHLR